MKVFKPTRWGSIKVFQAPCAIFQRQALFPNSNSSLRAPQALMLSPNSLTVLLVLYESAKSLHGKSSEPLASVRIKQELLIERTGYSKNIITKAVQSLQDKRFIKFEGQRKKYGEFGVNKYFLCDSSTGEPFKTTPGVKFLYANHASYFNLPVCIAREPAADWSIANLGRSAIAAYVSLSFLANKSSRNTIEVKPSELKTLCDLTKPTLKKALDELETCGLISIGSAGKEFTLNDPYTGEAVHEFTGDQQDDPARYSLTAENGGKRVNLNSGDPAQTERWLMECLPPAAEVIHQDNGDLTICCPFHNDKSPSCSVSPKKRCFHCFGKCKKNGTLTELVMKLLGISKGEVIQRSAAFAELEVEYHDPDKKAEAIYSYEDSQGKLLKQVLRYPGKKLLQRRPIPGGWAWETKRVRSILYKLPGLEFAHTVVITEGEKDADRVTNLKLLDVTRGEILATTSGNADSWSDRFAEHLLNKRVIVMPDSDEAGLKYKDAVIASLEKRQILHCVVTFDGFKDVSEYLDAGHTGEELAQRIADEWTKNVGQGDVIYRDTPTYEDISI
jgi:DNA-binding MarR family transcriptional regulator/5S rRNA maturation endonuclease (ribonuclease M5)